MWSSVERYSQWTLDRPSWLINTSPSILCQHLINTSGDSQSTLDLFLQTPHWYIWVSRHCQLLSDGQSSANWDVDRLSIFCQLSISWDDDQVLIECRSWLHQGHWSTLDRRCFWFTLCSRSCKVSLECLDTFWEDNRTINRNNASSPKTITAANKNIILHLWELLHLCLKMTHGRLDFCCPLGCNLWRN